MPKMHVLLNKPLYSLGDLLDMVFESDGGFAAFVEMCEKVLELNVHWDDKTQHFMLEKG